MPMTSRTSIAWMALLLRWKRARQGRKAAGHGKGVREAEAIATGAVAGEAGAGRAVVRDMVVDTAAAVVGAVDGSISRRT